MAAYRIRTGWTLIEVLVLITVLGILGLLTFPHMLAATEASRRTQCANNLKNIGLGIQNFHASYNKLPPSDLGPGYLSMYAVLLPYLDEGALHKNFNSLKKARWADNAAAMRLDAASLPVYLCASRRSGVQLCTEAGTGEPGATGDYGIAVVSEGPIWDTSYLKNRLSAIVAAKSQLSDDGQTLSQWVPQTNFATILDGMSKTMLLGEKHVASDNLNKGGEEKADSTIYMFDHEWQDFPVIRDARRVLRKGPNDNGDATAFGSWHPHLCNFAFADGSVRTFATSIDPATLEKLANRRDGASIDPRAMSGRTKSGWLGLYADTPKTVPVVDGEIQFRSGDDGAEEPVPYEGKGTIVFVNEKEFLAAWGELGPDGKFATIGTNELDDGAPPGNYNIYIQPPFSYDGKSEIAARDTRPTTSAVMLSLKNGMNGIGPITVERAAADETEPAATEKESPREAPSESQKQSGPLTEPGAIVKMTSPEERETARAQAAREVLDAETASLQASKALDDANAALRKARSKQAELENKWFNEDAKARREAERARAAEGAAEREKTGPAK